MNAADQAAADASKLGDLYDELSKLAEKHGAKNLAWMAGVLLEDLGHHGIGDTVRELSSTIEAGQ